MSGLSKHRNGTSGRKQNEHLARRVTRPLVLTIENLHVAEPLGAAATYIQMDLYTEMDLEEHPVSVPAPQTN